jgi:predicted DNA-binding transcriptional regulator YafY
MDRNFNRLLELLTLLPREGRVSTPELHRRLVARGFDVTPRTLQRDLEDLAQVYPIECDTRSRPYGWRWRSGTQRLSLPGMDWAEAVSFQMLATYLEGVLPGSVMAALRPYVDEARRKLAQHFQDLPLRRWPDRVRIIPQGPSTVPPTISKAVHAAVTEAVLLGRQLRISYRSFDKQAAKSYTVSPLGLVQFGNGFYMPVRFEGHEDVRTLKLHRVQRAELLDAPSGIERFDLAGWIEAGALGFGGSERIRLVARFFDSAGEWVQEAPLSEDQQVVPEGGGVHRVTADTVLTVQLRRWLLGLGSRVEILEPVHLRQEIAQELRTAASRYAGVSAAGSNASVQLACAT